MLFMDCFHAFESLFQELKPTHICCSFSTRKKKHSDSCTPTLSGAKTAMVDELSSHLIKLGVFLKSAKIPVYSKSGFEADDVIGTIATKTKIDGVVIVTGDRDILKWLMTEKDQAFHASWRTC